MITDVSYTQVPHWFDDATYRDLKMSLIFPKHRTNHQPLPVIVWLCGGGFLCMDRNVWLPQLIHLAQRGFIIASPEYRTSNETDFPAPLQDIKTAIRYLRANAQRYCIDSNRIYIMGESAGGTYAALCSVTNKDSRYDAGGYPEYSSDVQGAVDFYGCTDFRKLDKLMNTIAGQDVLLRAAHFFREHVDEGSAVLHVNKDTPPTLIFHGDADQLCPIEQSELYYEKLQKEGVRSDFYVLEGAGHGDDLFYQDNIYDIISSFLNEIAAM